MTDRILLVDDDPNLLEGYLRHLRKEFAVQTAVGSEQGLKAVVGRDLFAVIVSDLRMPGMDGIEFLSHVRELAPDSVRMLLTGNADLQTAIDAVNQGQIFRFLTKPCPPDSLIHALREGAKQHHLIIAEKELLDQTLSGCVKVLSDVLALVNPEAFGRSLRITRYVEKLAGQLGVSDLWVLRTAALLSQIGCVILPEAVLKKVYRREPLSTEEDRIYDQHPFVASDLLRNIPRMQPVAEIIAYQDKYFDGSGVPHDRRSGDAIPLGARILKVALDFDAMESAGMPMITALAELRQRHGWYDPSALEALKLVLADEIKCEITAVPLADLELTMTLAEDVCATDHVVLATKGQEVTQAMLMRLRSFAETVGVMQPITVFVPIRTPASVNSAP